MRGFIRAGRAAGVLAVAVAAAAGCGSAGSSDSNAAVAAKEKAIAEQSRLRLADFPSGWRADGQHKDSESKCAGVLDARKGFTARASSPDYTTIGADTLVQGGIYIYSDEQTATAKFAALSATGTRTCLAKELTDDLKRQAKAKGANFTVGKTKTGRLPIGPIGDQRGAVRITVPLDAQADRVDVTADLVFFRVGRAVAAMAFGDTFTPFDQDLRASLTSKVERRLTTSLEQAS